MGLLRTLWPLISNVAANASENASTSRHTETQGLVESGESDPDSGFAAVAKLGLMGLSWWLLSSLGSPEGWKPGWIGLALSSALLGTSVFKLFDGFEWLSKGETEMGKDSILTAVTGLLLTLAVFYVCSVLVSWWKPS